jgi:hypothetical protein
VARVTIVLSEDQERRVADMLDLVADIAPNGNRPSRETLVEAALDAFLGDDMLVTEPKKRGGKCRQLS